MQKVLFRCNECGLELTLHPPVTRPCPRCKGVFEEISTYSQFVGAKERSIDKQVEKLFPEMMDEIEDFLSNV